MNGTDPQIIFKICLKPGTRALAGPQPKPPKTYSLPHAAVNPRDFLGDGKELLTFWVRSVHDPVAGSNSKNSLVSTKMNCPFIIGKVSGN